MSDNIDRAQQRTEEMLEAARAYRKPVSNWCERCDPPTPVLVLSSGARARFCKRHLAEFLAEQASHPSI